MKYQEAVEFIDKHGKEYSFDEENRECKVYIAPTDPHQLEEFNRLFFISHFDPDVIHSFKNHDVCVMRGYKKSEPQEEFYYERVAQ